jgi:hypothetical protein
LQFWTFTPDSAANTFLGAAVKSFKKLQEFEGRRHHRQLQVMLYGKDYAYFQHNVPYVEHLVKSAPTHATARGWPGSAALGVHNHGVLSASKLHDLMAESFVYAGFGEPMTGPAPLEAMANGMIYLNYAFNPPRNLSKTMDKPTTQLWTSQFPFLERYQPHAVTVDPGSVHNLTAGFAVVRATYNKWWVQGDYVHVAPEALLGDYVFLGKTRGHRSGYLPLEYTTVETLKRVSRLLKLNVCMAPA